MQPTSVLDNSVESSTKQVDKSVIDDQQVVLYLPSTPLNILLSCSHAWQNRFAQKSVIVIIDQNVTENHPYSQALQNWSESPFLEVMVLGGNQHGIAKLRQRKAHFLILQQLIDQYGFTSIATGSDRRIEFQFAMHYATQILKRAVEGVYLDDGLYSYLGREYSYIKDFFGRVLKQMAYGSWYQEPATVGASNWIDHVWLFAPDMADKRLKNKELSKISTDLFTQTEIENLSRGVFQQFAINQQNIESYKAANLCILLPHPNNIQKIPKYVERLHAVLEFARQQNLKVLVKYHPREQQYDALNLQQKFNAVIIPAKLAFEFVLPQFNKEMIVIGDVGSAVLTSKWIRPELRVGALLDKNNALENRLAPLLLGSGVKVYDSLEEIEQALKK